MSKGVLLRALLVLVVTSTGGCDGDAMPAPTPTPPAATATATASARATATPSSTTTPTPSPLATATATAASPSPTATPVPLCAERRGGALITFSICDETLTVWSTAPAFIDEAIALLAAGEQRIPVLAILLDGTDCDRQWSWHADPAAMSFADLAIELCDGCPSHLEADKGYWLETVRQYCPWTARVTAVDDRRGALQGQSEKEATDEHRWTQMGRVSQRLNEQSRAAHVDEVGHKARSRPWR